MPTAAASGLPPNVLPWSPGVNTCIRLSVPTSADTGRRPPPSALPRITPSGFTFSCSHARNLPVRPMPVWISSQMSSTLRSRQIRAHCAR